MHEMQATENKFQVIAKWDIEHIITKKTYADIKN